MPAILAAVLSGTAPAQGQPSGMVRFSGPDIDRRLASEIRRLADIGADDSISVLLSAQGFLDHTITRAGDTVMIDPGMRYRIGDVDVTVIGSAGTEAETAQEYVGREGTRENVDKLKTAMVAHYQANGYYFASLNTDRVELGAGMITPHFRLITGPRVTIQRIRFKGLRKSKSAFVERLSGLREGDLLIRSRVEDAVRKIEAGGYLHNDSAPQLTPNESYDGVELLFFVSELKSNRLEFSGGYLPGSGTGESEIIGQIDFASKNLFGSGRRIDILLDRKDRASSRIEFRFAQPFFIPDHMEAAVHFNQVDYDSSYHAFTLDGGVTYFTRGHTRLKAGLSWTRTEPQRSSQPPSRTIAGSLGYEAQTLDVAVNPSHGRQVEVQLSYLRRSSWPDTAAMAQVNNESMFRVDLDNFFHLMGRLVFRVNLEARVLVTSRALIDYSEQFKLGGFGSLRGYRQDQFAGRRTVLGQGEFRLRSSSRLAVYLFADVGHVYARKETQPGIIKPIDITRAGSGFGLYAGSANVHMTMEVGWGRHDRIDEGKVHLGLVTLF